MKAARADDLSSEYSRLDQFALTRDPFVAKCGYVWSDKCGCIDWRFKWFETQYDLIHHLGRVEIVHAGFDANEQARISASVLRVLFKVNKEGLTEPLRGEMNAVDWPFQIQWWGSVRELVDGKTPFACEVIAAFVLKVNRGICHSSAEKRDFAKFLRSYR